MTNNQKFHALIVKVIGTHDHKDEEINSFYEEESLLNSLGGEATIKMIQHRPKPDPATYVGKGKVEEIKNLIKANSVKLILLNDIVSPGQIFRLEKNLWQVDPAAIVWDRYDLILSVFDKQASSSEAKLQIELARLRHLGPRIYGLGGTFLSRQAAGIGTRGLGETKLELMKRHIKNRLRIIEKKIAKIIDQKKEKIIRRRNVGIKTLALIGYTNAGKTSLFNLLTGKNKLVKDKAFTTLDSCVGKIKKLDHQQILVADTIGFVKNLPPALIDSFKSTLMESLYAEKVFHIVDIFDKKFQEKIAVVDQILNELGIEEKRIIYVFNKSDLVGEGIKENIQNLFLGKKIYFVSALTGQGVKNLLSFLGNA
jgi:GTP-binding protein HflX